MTYKTHKQFSISWVYLGAIFAYRVNISNINYYLMLMIMLSFGKAGALFPDVDHHWKIVKDKTVTKWVINKLIRLTGGKHRSWQTHSWDICIITTVLCHILSVLGYNKGILTVVNFELINIITLGFNLGWISHLFSDMLTSEGVRAFAYMKFKIAFVPKEVSKNKLWFISILAIGLGGWLGFKGIYAGALLIAFGIGTVYMAIKLGDIRFNTGKEWEAFVYKTTLTLNKVMGVVALAYPLIHNEKIRGMIIPIIKRV